MQFERNPFERDLQNMPLMRFLLHSDSLSSEMLLKDSPAYRLVKLNCFGEIEIVPLPTANSEVIKILVGNGLVFTEYYSSDSGIGLKASDGSIYNVVSRSPKNIWEPIISDSKVALADLFASNICDYLVVGATEPSLECKVAGDNIITAEKALEMVRIILTAHSRFYIGTGIPISEWFYYLYRFKKLFKWYQYAWTVAAYAHGKGLSEKIHDYLRSLGTRLEFICRAYDKVAFFSLKTANHENQNHQLYHLVYFIMLITGVFDVLAHTIEEFYNIRTNNLQSVSLRVLQDKEARQFYQTLQSKNTNLHTFLTMADTQRDIKAFYPLRDSLQHRELPTGVELHQSSEIGKNVFELNSETYERLKNISDSFSFIIRGNPCFLDPLLFIKWAQEITITIVNCVLSSMDWDSICVTLPKDIQDKIHASHERYEQGFGQLLGWPEEPLYF